MWCAFRWFLCWKWKRAFFPLCQNKTFCKWRRLREAFLSLSPIHDISSLAMLPQKRKTFLIPLVVSSPGSLSDILFLECSNTQDMDALHLEMFRKSVQMNWLSLLEQLLWYGEIKGRAGRIPLCFPSKNWEESLCRCDL